MDGRKVRGVEIFGWPVAVDADLTLDVSQPFHVGAEGDTIMAAQPLGDGRIGLFMVTTADSDT